MAAEQAFLSGIAVKALWLFLPAVPGLFAADRWRDETEALTGGSREAIPRYIATSHEVLLRPVAADCGVYALLAAARANGCLLDVDTLLQPTYLSDPRGMSANDLTRAAHDNGLHARTFLGLGLASLIHSDVPVILNLQANRGDQYGPSGHWVTFLGLEGEKLVIFDPARPKKIVKLDADELLLDWNGVGIVVSQEKINEFSVRFISAAVPLAGLIAACLLACSSLGSRQFPEWLMFAAAVTCAFALFVFAQPGHPLLSSAVTPWLKANETSSSTFPEISKQDVLALLTNESAILIDARDRDSFRQFHLARSMNVPIDGTIDEYRSALTNLDAHKPMVVFCAGPNCGWADVVARRLRGFGAVDVSIFRGGLQALVVEQLPPDLFGGIMLRKSRQDAR